MTYSNYSELIKTRESLYGDLLLLLEQTGSFENFRHHYLSRFVVNDFHLRAGKYFNNGIPVENIKDVLMNSFRTSDFEKMLIDCCVPVELPKMSKERRQEIIDLAKKFMIEKKSDLDSALRDEKDDYARVGIIQSVFREWKVFGNIKENEILHVNVKSWMSLARTSYSLRNIRQDDQPLLKSGDIPIIFKRAGKTGVLVDQIIGAPSFFGRIYMSKRLFEIWRNVSSFARRRSKTNLYRLFGEVRTASTSKDLGVKIKCDGLMLKNSITHETERSRKARHDFFSTATDREIILSSPLAGSLFVDMMAPWSLHCSDRVNDGHQIAYTPRAIMSREVRLNGEGEAYMHVPTWVIIQRYILTSNSKDFDRGFFRALVTNAPFDRDDWKLLEQKIHDGIISDLEKLDIEKTINNPDHYHRLHPRLRTPQLEEIAIRGNPVQLMDTMIGQNLLFDKETVDSLGDVKKKIENFQDIAISMMNMEVNTHNVLHYFDKTNSDDNIHDNAIIDIDHIGLF